MLNFFRRHTPKPIFSLYHFSLALLGNFCYGFPSRKMKLVGITGTKGKTTTSYFVYQILKNSGWKTALTSTVYFILGNKKTINATKMGMPGRFFLPHFLHRALQKGTKYTVVETTSEGIAQHRQYFLDYTVAVFTNLSPEHIERHGGLENYRLAKEKLFQQCSKIHVLNLDDENIAYCLRHSAKQKWGATFNRQELPLEIQKKVNFILEGTLTKNNRVSCSEWKIADKSLLLKKYVLNVPFVGNFNVKNLLLAIAVARSFGLSPQKIKTAATKLILPAGRMEEIKHPKINYRLFLDFAHEPLSLKSALETGRSLLPVGQKMIGLIGSQGGGRDRWKRPAMGKIATQFCDYIVISAEDPYDENPREINQEILSGVLKNKKFQLEKNCWQFTDRKKALKKALSLAKKDDLIILCGKGGEQKMCLKNKSIPWDENKIVREIIESQKG